MRKLFKGGTVVSGKGTKRADVLVDGEKIVRVARSITDPLAQTVDVTGKFLLPGFIDAHTHFDLDVANIPLIKESEKMDIKNLEEGYEQLCRDLPEYKISRVHGKMKAAEKEAEMQDFISGKTQILVATTVIEVGVNVPNASVMVIENAERFGLAQLHQLRGRVGRGADQSYCILVTKYQLSADTRKRIQIMTETNDGFEIAEADLKLRGPGDLEGTQQSGVSFTLRLANLARDGQVLQLARETAEKVLDDDPHCAASKNDILWRQLNKLRDRTVNWGVIS